MIQEYQNKPSRLYLEEELILATQQGEGSLKPQQESPIKCWQFLEWSGNRCFAWHSTAPHPKGTT
jgi:hypothetical protein